MTTFLRMVAAMLMVQSLAVQVEAASRQRGENVSVSGQHDDNIFAAGGRVRTDAESKDDIFLAGGRITGTARTSENLFATGGEIILDKPQARLGVFAGGDVRLADAEFRELVLAGGDVKIDRIRIADDLTLAGGEVTIGKEAHIGGSTTVMGGEILFAGTGKAADLKGREITITGRFDGPVNIRADKLVIASSAVIGGDLTHSARIVDISQSAQIAGQTVALDPPGRGMGTWFTAGAIFWTIMFAIGVLLAPAIVVYLFPSFTGRARERMHAELGASLFKGFLFVILAPPLIILLMATVIGVPIGLFAIPFVLVALFLGWAVGVRFVGDWLYRKIRRDRAVGEPPTRGSIFGWTLLGAVALFALLMVPVLGFLLNSILELAGLGAVFSQFWSRFRAPISTEPRATEPREQMVPAGV